MNPTEIIHELRMASGSNRKKVILRTYQHNDDWLEILKAMYDTSINYYTSAPKDATFVDEVNVEELLEDLGMLSSRTYTGNAARTFALDCSQAYGEIFRLILGGSLKAGISTTTINSVYPGLIPEFKVMLAKDTDRVRYPILASTKYDGVRVIAFVNNRGGVTLKTRQGKILQVDSLKNQMSQQIPGVYDGELVSGNGKQAGRTTITGQVNKCLKGTATDIDNYTFCIFDYIPLEAWARRQCTWTYAQRHSTLKGMIPTTNVLVADQVRIDNPEQVEELYQGHINDGYEGLILRSEDDPYLWTRSATLIKKKATNECTLGCYEVQEGQGKYQGMIGALLCAGNVHGKQVRVKVGSGLSDFDREGLRAYYVGSDIEVLYNDIVRAEGASHFSLFLPRFKRVARDLSI